MRKMRFTLGLARQPDLPGDRSRVERAGTKSTPEIEISQNKMAKDSISRLVSPEKSGVALSVVSATRGGGLDLGLATCFPLKIG